MSVIVDGIHFEPGEVSPVMSYWLSKPSGEKTSPITVVKSKSFLKQFLQLFYVQMLGINDTLIGGPLADELVKARTGFSYFIGPNKYNMWAVAAAGDATVGILVGKGSTPVAFDDYDMETVVVHGTGVDQLQYGASGFGYPAADAVSAHFRLSRVFSNASGNLVNVTEVGAAVRGYHRGIYTSSTENTTAYSNFLIVHDLFGVGGVDIPAGQQLTVNYDFKAVV